MPYSIPELAKRSIIPPNLEPDHFPRQITLPETIATYAAEAVHQTNIDERERDTGFSFKNQKWVAGLSRLGAKVSLEDGVIESRGGHMGILFHALNRPEIAMHTRPTPRREITDEMAKAHFADHEMSEELLAQKQDTMWRHSLAMYAVATRVDIESTYDRSHGTVGNMISTCEGLFLWIRRNTKHEATLHEDIIDRAKDTYDLGRNGRAIIRRTYQSWSRQLIPPAEQDITTLRAAYAQTAAATLSMHYACYMNNDPSSRKMQKVLPHPADKADKTNDPK